MSKTPPISFGHLTQFVAWRLSAQRDRAPAELRSTVIVTVRVAKEPDYMCLYVHYRMIATIAVL
jgi:hypothetical protein